jgi:hypothetical protein
MELHVQYKKESYGKKFLVVSLLIKNKIINHAYYISVTDNRNVYVCGYGYYYFGSLFVSKNDVSYE